MIGDDKEEMAQLKKLLAQEFEIKGLKKFQYFMRIEVTKLEKGIYFSKEVYYGFLDRDYYIGLQASRISSRE